MSLIGKPCMQDTFACARDDILNTTLLTAPDSDIVNRYKSWELMGSSTFEKGCN